MAFLEAVKRTSESRVRSIPVGFRLWRAQLGHAWAPYYDDDGIQRGEVPAAYPAERMKPLEGRAKEGRANPKGIAVLYLSTKPEIAMFEVRPWLGSLVSCGFFKINRALKIVDFSVRASDLFEIYFSEPDAPEREKSVWTHLDNAFSEPTTSDDNHTNYVPTQVIAELFKNEGYDGVAYKSAFGKDGYNIALFDLNAANLKSCALFSVKDLKLNFSQSDNAYHVDSSAKPGKIMLNAMGPAGPPSPPPNS